MDRESNPPCYIIVHPAGGLDAVDGAAQFWSEVPSVPDCSMVEGATPEEAGDRTIRELQAWIRSREDSTWRPIDEDTEFVIVQAW